LETDSESTKYHEVIRDPMSLVELTAKVHDNGFTKGRELSEFSADLYKIFNNAITWHAGGRWIADTVDDIDPNRCTAEELDAAQTRDFTTAATESDTSVPQIFTVAEILAELNIPTEFTAVTVEENRRSMPHLSSATEVQLDWGTSLLLPHNKDVAAVKWAKKLLKRGQKTVANIEASLEKDRRAVAGGVDDHFVECARCKRFRRIPPAARHRYAGADVIFRCPMEGRTCHEPSDDSRDDVEIADGGNDNGGSRISSNRSSSSTAKPRGTLPSKHAAAGGGRRAGDSTRARSSIKESSRSTPASMLHAEQASRRGARNPAKKGGGARTGAAAAAAAAARSGGRRSGTSGAPDMKAKRVLASGGSKRGSSGHTSLRVPVAPTAAETEAVEPTAARSPDDREESPPLLTAVAASKCIVVPEDDSSDDDDGDVTLTTV
jgi:hypothetical protein